MVDNSYDKMIRIGKMYDVLYTAYENDFKRVVVLML